LQKDRSNLEFKCPWNQKRSRWWDHHLRATWCGGCRQGVQLVAGAERSLQAGDASVLARWGGVEQSMTRIELNDRTLLEGMRQSRFGWCAESAAHVRRAWRRV